MTSIITTIVVFLLIFNNYSVAFANTRQPNNSRSNKPNTVKKDSPNRQRQTQSKQKPLDFSDTGRPGQQTAGESRGNCINTERDLSAVIPASHSGKTTSGHPRFWVYFPYTRQQINRIEFIIQNEAREDIWRSQIKRDGNEGYQSFSMPTTAAPLEVGQWYRWYVKVYCNSQLASAEYVQGWVRRVPLLSDIYLELQQESIPSHQIYSDRGIWYDAVDRLLALYKSEPGNMSLEQDWQNLIKAKGVELDSLPQVGATYEAIE